MPTEDIKSSISALSLQEDEMTNLMNYKFKNGKLSNLSFGDIYLSAMQNTYGDFTRSIEKSSDILSIVGKVLPVTLDEMKICAELKDGTIIEEKHKISEIVSQRVTEINRVYINPSNCRIAPGIMEAIKEADSIVIGPGSLYTNVIPNLLIKNVAKAIRDSKAQKVYVCNIMTEPGQTDDYDVSDHINAIIDHAGEGIIDYCVCDTGEIVPEIVRKYNMAGSNIVNTDIAKIRDLGIKPLKGDFATVEDEHIKHNSDETAKVIIELIVNEAKFKDKKPDEQFMLLNKKLKETNKNGKIVDYKKEKKAKHSKIEKNASKFTNKYQDRIESIKNSDKTREKNREIREETEKIVSAIEAEQKEKFLEELYKKKD